MIPVSRHPEPLHFEEWLPLRGRWLWLFLDGFRVVSLVLLLGGITVFQSHFGYIRCGGRSPHDSARVQIGNLKTAIELYRVDHRGTCPGRLQDLISAPLTRSEGKRWKGPYLQDVTFVPPDPWGRPYFYRVPGPGGAAYEILSLGKDGCLGGTEEAEDLTSEPQPSATAPSASYRR